MRSSIFAILILFLFSVEGFGQSTDKPQKKAVWGAAAYDGIVILGYVDSGGYSNFTGPNINMTYGHSKFILGALPSLRYKQDNSTPKNAFVTPNLGIGFTYSYKIWAIQVPLYYNSKTATADGKWHVGLGLGLRLNYINSN